MRTRPWPLVFLAAFQVVAPFFNAIWCAYLMKISFFNYVTSLNQSSTTLQIFEFYALGPIAGFAIYKCRKWSYPVFISITAWTVYRNFVSWQEFPQIVNLTGLIVAYSVNVLLVGYFLIPAVRMTYFNPKLRWWETDPRYEIHVDGKVGHEGQWRDCHVANLSVGGVFLEFKNGDAAAGGSQVDVDFRFLEIPFQMQGRVVYRTPDGKGCGVQFAISREMSRKLRRFVKGLDVLGIERTHRRTHWATELAHWGKGLITRGTGLVPEIPGAKPAAAPIPIRTPDHSDDQKRAA